MAAPGIVHVIHALRTGGLENGLINLVTRTPEFRHTLVCLAEVGDWRDRLPAGVEALAVGKREGSSLLLLVRLAGLLRRLRPDVVHTRNWAAFDGIPAARLAGVTRIVHGEHGREATDPRGENRRRNRLRRLLHPWVGRFVAVTRDLGGWLVHTVGIPARKVTVIANGVDMSRFGGQDRLAARRSLGLDERSFVVGSVGRLDPVKDYATLVEAFATLGRSREGSALLIAGDGPERERLEAQIDRAGLAGQVRLLGERRDVPALLAALDVFVLPSIAEGMSNVILEAMASAVPVVATAVGGNTELVEDGTSGYLVPPRTPRAVAEALARYATKPHLGRLHGKAGRERVLERFTLDRMAADYRHLYEELLARGSA